MSVNTKAAWGRIRQRLEEALSKLEQPRADVDVASMAFEQMLDTMFGGSTEQSEVKSINDEIQREYRAQRITEDERNAMREHVKVWLGDPDAGHRAHVGTGYFADSNNRGYDTYSCGLWVPTAAPDGEVEHSIVLMAVTIMELEDEPVSPFPTEDDLALNP